MADLSWTHGDRDTVDSEKKNATASSDCHSAALGWNTHRDQVVILSIHCYLQNQFSFVFLALHAVYIYIYIMCFLYHIWTYDVMSELVQRLNGLEEVSYTGRRIFFLHPKALVVSL